jgi:hypothetical protein
LGLWISLRRSSYSLYYYFLSFSSSSRILFSFSFYSFKTWSFISFLLEEPFLSLEYSSNSYSSCFISISIFSGAFFLDKKLGPFGTVKEGF